MADPDPSPDPEAVHGPVKAAANLATGPGQAPDPQPEVISPRARVAADPHHDLVADPPVSELTISYE